MQIQTDIRHQVQQVMERAVGLGASFAEVFVEVNVQDEIRFESQQIDQIRGGTELGVGVRVVKNSQTAYSIVNTLDTAVLLTLVENAMAGLHQGTGITRSSATKGHIEGQVYHQLCDEPLPKVNYLQVGQELAAIDTNARKASAWIQQVAIQFLSHRRQILVANSKGVWQNEVRSFTRVNAQAVANRRGFVQTGVNNVALTVDEARLFERYPAAALGEQVGNTATILLDAIPTPTGILPIVVSNGRGGVLVHEACVHCLEADYISRENSVYNGRLGQMVAKPIVTIIDDGTMPDLPGTSVIDDEGCPTQYNVLVEKGRLQSYLTDRMYAKQLDYHLTGNGRRQSYAFLPMPRMTNTYVAPGEDTPEEIIAETSYGIYARRVSGGQVNPVTGEFVFTVTEGYLIEDGQLTKPLITFTLTGNGPGILQNIDRVAHDFELAAVMCGKNGQFVPVSVGQPTIRVQGLVVGGTRR